MAPRAILSVSPTGNLKRFSVEGPKEAMLRELATGRRVAAALSGGGSAGIRGSQYACQAYQGLLAAQGLRCSMSRKGECLDNAVAERFFGSLKGEGVAHHEYATRQDVRADVIEYIEMFHNSTRLHSSLGYRSSNAYEALFTAA